MACAVPQKCAPRFKTLIRLYFCLPLLLSAFALVWSLAYLSPRSAVAWGTVTGLCIFAAVFLPGMYYERRFYTRYAQWLKLETGLFVRTITLVPRGQVLCTRLRRGPLERMLGLYTVILVTAAGQVPVPGLLREDAARLRELAPLDHASRSRTGSGSAAHSDAAWE